MFSYTFYWLCTDLGHYSCRLVLHQIAVQIVHSDIVGMQVGDDYGM
jgi:hypothetical protein